MTEHRTYDVRGIRRARQLAHDLLVQIPVPSVAIGRRTLIRKRMVVVEIHNEDGTVV